MSKWKAKHGSQVVVEPHKDSVFVHLSDGDDALWVWVGPGQARRIAKALLSAADAMEGKP